MKLSPVPDALRHQPLPAAGLALWNLGFRPFYLLASIFSAFSVLAWAAQYSGWLPYAYLQGSLWHGHEMLFGYTIAVIAALVVALVLAGISVRQIRWREERGKGFAIAALMIAVIAAIVTAMVTAVVGFV